MDYARHTNEALFHIQSRFNSIFGPASGSFGNAAGVWNGMGGGGGGRANYHSVMDYGEGEVDDDFDSEDSNCEGYFANDYPEDGYDGEYDDVDDREDY